MTTGTDSSTIPGALVPTTVGDLDFTLPIGFDVNGIRHTSFAFKPWLAKDERTLGAIRSKKRNIGIGEFVSEVLAHFMTKFGPHDFTAMPSAHRRVLISQAWAADVYHAWLMLRRENIDDEYMMSVRCGACESQFDYSVPLDKIECLCATDETILRKPLMLKHGFEYRGEIRKLVTIQPARWATFEQLHTTQGNLGDVKLRLIENGIVGIEGVEGDIVVPTVLLDSLTKRDVEALISALSDNQPGPDLSLEITCPNCRTLLHERVDWSYDPFFSVQSSTR